MAALTELDYKIADAKRRGVPENVIMERVRQKYPDYKPKGQPFGQKVSGALEKLGLGALGVIPGAAYELYRGAKYLTGDKNAYYNPQTRETIENPFLSQQKLDYIAKHPVQQITRQSAGLASYAIPGAKLTQAGLLPFLGSSALRGAARGGLFTAARPESGVKEILGGAATGAALETPFSFLKAGLGTKKGLAGLTEKATAEATEAGKKVNYWDLTKQIKEKVYDKLGKTAEVRKSVDNLLAGATPAQLPHETAMNPTELLNWRRQILAREGGRGLLEKLFKGSDIDSKVANIARTEISQNVHRLAPGSISPDLIYTLYSKGGPLAGDVPEKLRKLFLAYFVKKFGSSIISPLIKSLVTGE